MADITLPHLTSSQFADPVNISILTDAVRKIVDTEAPVCLEVIMDRLCNACSIQRKTSAVKDRVYYLIKSLRLPVCEENVTLNGAPDYDRLFVWDSDGIGKVMPYYRKHSDEQLREAWAVPIEEASCAAIYLCRSQFGMPRDALVHETGKALGFKTVTPTVRLLCEKAVDFAVNLGELTGGDRLIK